MAANTRYLNQAMAPALILTIAIILGGCQVLACPFDEWFQARSEPNERLAGIAYGDGHFVAVGTERRADGLDYGFVITSEDAVKWNKLDTNLKGNRFGGVVYQNGIWLIWSNAKWLRSTDFQLWHEEPSPFSSVIHSITVGSGEFYALLDNTEIAASRDGINWRLVSKPFPRTFNTLLFYGGQIWRIGNEQSDTGTVLGIVEVSSTGESWEERPGPWRGIFSAVAAGNGLIIIGAQTPTLGIGGGDTPFQGGGGEETLFYVSSDGIQWTEVDPGNLFLRVDKLFFLNGTFLAELSNDALLTSVAGKSWDYRRTLPQNFNPSGVLLANNRYVVVGDKGILLSPDITIPCLEVINEQSRFKFQVSGKVGVNYDIELSADLKEWATWTNFTAEAGYTSFFHNAEEVTEPIFFRARTVSGNSSTTNGE